MSVFASIHRRLLATQENSTVRVAPDRQNDRPSPYAVRVVTSRDLEPGGRTPSANSPARLGFAESEDPADGRRIGTEAMSESRASSSGAHPMRLAVVEEHRPASGSGFCSEALLAIVAGAATVASVLALSANSARRQSPSDLQRILRRADPPPRRQPALSTDSPTTDGLPVLGYATVAPSASLRAASDFREQAAAVLAACERRGLVLLELVRERESAHATGVERPGLAYALDRISAGEAKGLVVADLSRLSRSVAQLGRVLEWFSRWDARLVAAAQGLDSAERDGQLALRTLIDVCAWERELLGERTRKGLEAARSKGRPTVSDKPELSNRIAAMRTAGMTLQAIADRLNAEGVPTVRGGARWRPSSVQAAAGYRRPPFIGSRPRRT